MSLPLSMKAIGGENQEDYYTDTEEIAITKFASFVSTRIDSPVF